MEALKTADVESSNLSITGKRWELVHADARHSSALSQKFNLPEIVGRIMAGRGFTAEDEALSEVMSFLSPSFQTLADPLELKDMNKAVERLHKAVKDNEQIAVFGDYDVDGSCATAILLKYFRALGHQPILYIPDRLSEGYGPNPAAMRKIAEQGAKVAITVDTGSLAFEAMEAAAEAGLDMIITDHHQTKPNFPVCTALVNPNRVDETGDLSMLSGAGVAFYLVMALNRTLRADGYFDHKTEPKIAELVDLVAVSTVCDMVPLKGVNRVFVSRGLQMLAQRKNMGLSALSQVVNKEGAFTTFDLGFVIGPRINAGGRISECDLGAKLLATDDPDEARTIAARLDILNEERKEIERHVTDQALLQAQKQFESGAPALVVSGKGWHPGVVGIAAARVKEAFHRPVFVLSIDEKEGVLKGSGRSVKGVDMGQAVLSSKDLLVSGGGHAMAAGITVTQDNLEAFVAQFNQQVMEQAEQQPFDVFVPSINVDGMLAPGGANAQLMSSLGTLEPFGTGHPEPRFVVNGRLSYVRAVGADQSHVQVALSGMDGSTLRGIAFKAMDSELGPYLLGSKDKTVSLCGVLKVDEWQGRTQIKMQVKDAWGGIWQPEAI